MAVTVYENDSRLNWINAGWVTATPYTVHDALLHNGTSYRCILAHTSGASTEPGIGGSWATNWAVVASKGATGAIALVRDEGVDMALRSKLNFIGAGVTLTDDAANDETEITIAGGGGGAGALTLISNQVLGAAAGDFTFAGIVNSYNHLRLVLTARSDTAANSTALNLRFNGDTGANYNFMQHYAVGVTPGSAGLAGHTFLQLGSIVAGSAVAGRASQTVIDILSYKGTTFQKSATALTHYIYDNSAGNFTVLHGAGIWRNTAAITDIVVTPGAGQFVTGSHATLYGVT